MTWESSSVLLACGCAGSGAWASTEPGDEQICDTHGKTTVRRVSRVTESRGPRGTSPRLEGSV